MGTEFDMPTVVSVSSYVGMVSGTIIPFALLRKKFSWCMWATLVSTLWILFNFMLTLFAATSFIEFSMRASSQLRLTGLSCIIITALIAVFARESESAPLSEPPQQQRPL